MESQIHIEREIYSFKCKQESTEQQYYHLVICTKYPRYVQNLEKTTMNKLDPKSSLYDST